jgi:hypothetical protein
MTKVFRTAYRLTAKWNEGVFLAKPVFASEELFIDGVITVDHIGELVARIDAALQQDEIAWRDVEEMKEGLKMVGTEREEQDDEQ